MRTTVKSDMSPNGGKSTKRGKASALPENIRNAIAQAIKADIAAEREPKGTVKVDNPDCIAYPCQCASSSYCCACEGIICAMECQDGCDTFQYLPCYGEGGNKCGCVTDSDCPGLACEGSQFCQCSQ